MLAARRRRIAGAMATALDQERDGRFLVCIAKAVACIIAAAIVRSRRRDSAEGRLGRELTFATT